MNKKILSIAAVLAVIFSIPAYAEDNLGFRVKTGVSYVDYTAPSGFLLGTAAYKAEFRTKYQAYNLGLAYVSPEGSFFDFTVRQDTGRATWDSGKGLSGLPGYENIPPKQKAQRTEYTLTVGTSISETIQLFGGYQASNYQVNAMAEGWGSNMPGINPYVYIGPVTFTNYIAMSGFFAGLSKGFSLGGGVLNLNGSFSLMSAMTESDVDYVSGGGAIMNTRTTKNYAAGLGYGVGVTYAYPINSTFSLSTDLKYHSYRPDKYPKADRSKSIGLNLISSF